MSDDRLQTVFKSLLAGDAAVVRREVRWTEWREVRLPRSSWGNSLDSKFGEVPETRTRIGYFLGDEEIHDCDAIRLAQLVEARGAAPALIARLREAEAAPGWEWVDHVSRKATWGDKLSEIVPEVRETLERALTELSLGLSQAAARAGRRLEQVEAFLPALAEVKAREEEGCLPFFGGWLHTSGVTGSACYWVVRPDGTLRDCDHDEYSRSHKRGSHTQWWDLVKLDELALWWAKGSNASDHEFEVHKLPVGGCTEAQLETVLQLEAELENAWYGRCGLASRRPSPSVGDGWGLHPADPQPEPAKSVADGGEAASADALAALREKFRK